MEVAFAKAQLKERLKDQDLQLVEDSVVLTPKLVMMPFNIMKSVVNVEYEWYANIKTWDVEFKAVDTHEKTVAGYTYLNQANCDIHKKGADCEYLATQKEFGITGPADNQKAMFLVTEPSGWETKTLDFHLRPSLP